MDFYLRFLFNPQDIDKRLNTFKIFRVVFINTIYLCITRPSADCMLMLNKGHFSAAAFQKSCLRSNSCY